MKRILLTGKNGQIGCELQHALSSIGHITALDSSQMDLTDPDAIRHTVQNIRPDIIINAAAYTAVDKAESEPDLAMAVNGIAPGILAKEAASLGAVLVHFSTDYVFDGDKTKPYKEEDVPNPQNVYGRSKLNGEQAILSSGCNHLILRTSWVYGLQGRNFMKTILQLAKERNELSIVSDQVGAPTWARDLAQVTASILQVWDPSLGGVYHLTAAGCTNWHDYACEIVRLARQYDTALNTKPLEIRAITTSEYPVPANRPANSMLANDKFHKACGLELPAWQVSLTECVQLLYAPQTSH